MRIIRMDFSVYSYYSKPNSYEQRFIDSNAIDYTVNYVL